ncbi:hypothetical protein K432DRAFT_392436 [Lepidopterella palustris CBS 459.81]|uniref:C2H2-type domain-containing protein n=1 Tax=Lepidopterella palustris CBS 459.81 TaxID=1314670 RepID=A0A8E2EBT1_9PEZI|nr:hypothetical protein K432DRAFT_392436 [Lepidopterella palustris CBS 459.81]
MDAQQRGRSPSADHQNHIRHSPSPSPNGPYHTDVTGLGLERSLSNDPYSQNNFNTQPTVQSFDISSQYLNTSQPQQFQSQPSIAEHTFLQAQGIQQRSASPQFRQQGNLFSQDLLDLNNSGGSNEDFGQYFSGNNANQEQSIDPSFLGTLDPHLLDSQPQDQSVDPSSLMNQMATTQAHSPTPPHLLQPGMNRPNGSPHASPNMNQGAFPSPGHSRHASLDPSAAYGQQSAEWGGMATFRTHRRAPSDTYSDVSSSAQPSPYLGNNDSFDHNDNPSPLLGAQQDPALFQDVMQFGQFTLNENRPLVSPGPSPHISPRLLPQQQSLPPFTPSNNYGLNPSMNNQFAQPHGMEMYHGQGQEPFPTINQGAPVDFGHADQMSPPEINIDFAPPSRQPSFEPAKSEGQTDALSPPDRSRSRNRIRAKSDPFSGASSRASTPASGRSDPSRSLSPHAAAKPSSRSPSPSTKSCRRSSTSSIPHRDYILDLADPTRPTSQQSAGDALSSNPKRTQKHPATFQCSLCPKRFTRAYNLRSHLRTHTDERPFVCSVCGKAFARQHDRKRHEGLHSGEKKFVCRGVLKDQNNWGCGRRFARADALGRHFRSEAGRVCIRPLLEEEALEKGGWDAQSQAMSNGNSIYTGQMQPQSYGGMMPQQQGYEGYPSVSGGMDHTGASTAAPQAYGLPAALLAQYPALAGIQWDQLPPGPPDDVEGEISGRSSFDASSGGEFFDEEDGEFGASNTSGAYGAEWTSDFEGSR